MGETSSGERGHDADRVDWFGLPSAAMVRSVAGLLVAALAAVLGALILGEYQFEGLMPVIAGLLFGLAVAEIAVEIGRRPTWGVALACGAFTAVGLAWAGWISAGEGLGPVPGGAWLAAAIGAVAAIVSVVGSRI